MKYMTDANIAHVAPKLRKRGIDCETVHKRMRNNEDSRVQILDGEIVAFPQESRRNNHTHRIRYRPCRPLQIRQHSSCYHLGRRGRAHSWVERAVTPWDPICGPGVRK